MSAILTMENFKDLIGKTCVLKEGDSSYEIEILDVIKLKKKSDVGHPDPFVVEVRCRQEEILPQKIHTISGEGLDDQAIYFSAVGKDSEGHLYEAVFN